MAFSRVGDTFEKINFVVGVRRRRRVTKDSLILKLLCFDRSWSTMCSLAGKIITRLPENLEAAMTFLGFSTRGGRALR